jgi:competence protein ComEA
MAAPSAVPVPPVPPAAPPEVKPDAPVPRRTQAAILLLLMVSAGLIGGRWYADRHGTRPTLHETAPVHRVDLNRGTRAELMQLPGVGPQLADRIVAHRDQLGGFGAVDDLRDVHGIGDLTLNKLRPWLTVHPADEPLPEPDRLTRKPSPGLHVTYRPSLPDGRIDLNTATAEELNTLPNIGPVLVQRIIEERTRQPFTSVDDLRRVNGIGPKRIEAIRPRATVGD